MILKSVGTVAIGLPTTARYCRWWEIRIPSAGTAAWLFDKDKYYELKLGFVRQAPNLSTIELPQLIVTMSGPTIGNTFGCRLSIE